ncbi:MAG: phage terminase large subunit [Chromatiales bacterium]|nr:phage terminase large subunit [Chromatiales bacterium]
MHRQYRCLVWGIESVQFQEFLRTELIKRSAKAGCPVPARAILPHADKQLRIESLQPHVANGLIRFHPSHTTLLEQLRHFPAADHDDGPDALHMLWMLATTSGAGLSAQSTGRTRAGAVLHDARPATTTTAAGAPWPAATIFRGFLTMALPADPLRPAHPGHARPRRAPRDARDRLHPRRARRHARLRQRHDAPAARGRHPERASGRGRQPLPRGAARRTGRLDAATAAPGAPAHRVAGHPRRRDVARPAGRPAPERRPWTASAGMPSAATCTSASSTAMPWANACGRATARAWCWTAVRVRNRARFLLRRCAAIAAAHPGQWRGGAPARAQVLELSDRRRS